jgi:hypothetical protein
MVKPIKRYEENDRTQNARNDIKVWYKYGLYTLKVEIFLRVTLRRWWATLGAREPCQQKQDGQGICNIMARSL